MTHQEFMAEVKALTDRVEAVKGRPASEQEETYQKLAAELQKLQDKVARDGEGRAGEYQISDADKQRGDRLIEALKDNPSERVRGGGTILDALMQTDPNLFSGDDQRQIVDAQNALDDAYIVYALTAAGGNALLPRNQKRFLARMKGIPMLHRSISTVTEANWVPTAFSSQLHEQFRIARRVAGQIERTTMPSDPYKLPIEGADASVYRVPQNSEPDADLTAGFRVPNGMTPNAGAGVLTLTSDKLGTRIVFSTELTEDSIIRVAPYFRRKVVRAFVDAEEDVTINGKKTTALDSDVTSAGATDRRFAWDGFRAAAQTGSKINNLGGITIGLESLRSMRQSMGKYGLDPSNLFWLAGTVNYFKLLAVTQQGVPIVTTVDKIGNRATVITGQMGEIDGSPIFTSAYMRNDTSITGVYDGVTTDRDLLACVFRDAFIYGDRREMTIKGQEVITTDQIMTVGLVRQTMGNWFAGDPVVSILYNIKNT